MSWIVLVVAAILEIGWAIGLKYTDGFTRPWPVIGTVVGSRQPARLFCIGLILAGIIGLKLVSGASPSH